MGRHSSSISLVNTKIMVIMNRIILTVALAIATLPTVFTACATEVVKEIPVEVVIEK